MLFTDLKYDYTKTAHMLITKSHNVQESLPKETTCNDITIRAG